jgi:quinol monooxygenase YgiN
MRFAATVIGMALFASLAAVPLRTADAQVYVLTYLEVGSDSAKAAADLMHKLRHGMRTEKGVVGDTLLIERGRPTRLAVLDAFPDKAAADAHAANLDTQKFRGDLHPMLVAPPDVRHLITVDTKPQTAPSGPRAVYVLTHVDVIPTFKEQTEAALKSLAAAARQDPGCLRWDVLVQDNRANHFTVVETWRDIGAFERYRSAAATRDFRDKLGPMQGALYDQRLYEAVP